MAVVCCSQQYLAGNPEEAVEKVVLRQDARANGHGKDRCSAQEEALCSAQALVDMGAWHP